MAKRRAAVNGASKAIGYVRVSTEHQASEGVSLEAQRERIRAYCEAAGLELAGVHSDDGISAKRADNRPGLQRALREACRGKAVLVVYSLSRLARSVRDAIDIAAELDSCGADLASISERIDTTSAMGRFFFHTMAALSQLERDQVSERTRDGMAKLRQDNRRISRHIPYGFNLADDGQTLVPDESERRIIRQIARRRDNGDSLRAIAHHLNERGIRPKRGVKWYASSVRSVLSRVNS